MPELQSVQLEQNVLAGIFKYPQSFYQLDQLLTDEDFVANKMHRTIFQIIRSLIHNNEAIDHVVVAQRVKDLNIQFDDGLNAFDFLQSLSLKRISESAVETSAKELKKYSVRRDICLNADKIKKAMISANPSAPLTELINTADSIYNKQIDTYANHTVEPENIFKTMEQVIEERGENPDSNIGLMGPFRRVNDLYGSLSRAGNITVVVARTGAGKSTLALQYNTWLGEKYGISTIHLDNGEMSLEETQMRQCASMTGVPLYLIESGSWRNNQAASEKIRALWPRIRDMKFYYYSIAGQTNDQILNICRRTYFSKIGRGKEAIISLDYIKSREVDQSERGSWETIGHMLDGFKGFIQREIVFDGKPKISMFTSVQANRIGIARNGEVEDSEAIVGLSDMISQFSSHLFILRRKTDEEAIREGNKWGTHKMINLKSRHLGEKVGRALDLVELPDGSKSRNAINLEINNFQITERGDLHDWMDSLDVRDAEPQQD